MNNEQDTENKKTQHDKTDNTAGQHALLGGTGWHTHTGGAGGGCRPYRRQRLSATGDWRKRTSDGL